MSSDTETRVEPSPVSPTLPSTGIHLADGTTLDDLIDLEARTVELRTCADEQIFELEMERVFGRAWLVVAHESEIPRPNDYVTRRMALDEVIVSRDKKGSVHVSLNSCSHRSSPVCRAGVGNTRQFTCPYHGWVYDTGGNLVGVPGERNIYGPGGLQKPKMGLAQARVEVFCGWVFATWDQQAPALETTLGPYGAGMRLCYDRTDSGMEVVGPPQRWMVNANWKLAVEQFSGDAYHATITHSSLIPIGKSPSFEKYINSLEWSIYAEIADDYEEVLARDGRIFPPGLTSELYEQACKRSSTFAAFHEAVPLGPGAAPTFPNFSSIFLNGAGMDGKLASMMSPRQFVPQAVDLFEELVWVIVEKDAPEEVKEKARLMSTQGVSASGTFEQDDSEMWAGIQRSAAGPMGRRRKLDYRADGVHQVAQPGTLMKGINDNAQWMFWVRWLDFMADEPWQQPFTNALPTSTFGLDALS